jgi:tRNA (cytosine34-C5)-methyltransferase
VSASPAIAPRVVAAMGGKRSRSRAMVLARKKRGSAPPPPPDLTGGHPFESPANPRKKRFGDESDDDGGDDEAQMKGYASMVNVPPPPSPSQSAGVAGAVPGTTPARSRPTAVARQHRVTHFEAYYRAQRLGFVDESEWTDFFAHLRRPLPVTFRMSKMASLAAGVREALREGDDVLRPKTPVRTDAGRIVPPPRELAWCGGYQLGCDKNALKFSSDETLRHTQKWLVRHNSTGVLTRQAVDSMVPAAILGVEPHHRVLDLCASPGSKTTQALELLFRADATSDSRRAEPSGCVVANDISPRRCYFLVRRCAALGAATEALMVTNHHAQWFPNPSAPLSPLFESPSARARGTDGSQKTAKETNAKETNASPRSPRYPAGTFDRIICDVPCSGDGTLRKNPQIWNEWRPEFAIGLHALQLRIALRGVALLKVGGYMVYSTCSFNPVENEAVVAALVEKCGGAVEIVDASDRVRGLRRRAGMTTWKVLTAEDEGAMTEWKTFEDTRREGATISPGLRRAFARSVFPPKASGVTKLGKRIKGPPLERCMRLVPHDQDMGGFFATLLRKVGPIPGPPPRRAAAEAVSKNTKKNAETPEDAAETPLPPMTTPTPKTHAYVPVRTDVLRALNEAWGTDMTAACLFARDASATPATLTYFAPGARAQCAEADGASRVKCVWGGARVFERRGAGVGEWKPRKPVELVGAGSSLSDLGEDDVLEEERVTAASFVSRYRLTQDGASALARARSASSGPDGRFVAMPSRDVEKLLSSFGRDVPFKHLTPGSRRACEALSPGSIAVVLKGGGADDGACPPLAAERAADDALRLDWRYRRGLEGAPRAAADAIARRLRENREARG